MPSHGAVVELPGDPGLAVVQLDLKELAEHPVIAIRDLVVVQGNHEQVGPG